MGPLQEYCKRHNIQVSDILDAVTAMHPLQSGEYIVAAGSVIDELSNQESDLDLLYVVEDTTDTTYDFKNAKIFSVGTAIIDVEYFSILDIEKRVAQARLFSSTAGRETRDSLIFEENDLKLLHLLSHSQLLAGNSPSWLNDPQLPRIVARLNFDRAAAWLRSVIIDVRGAFLTGDIATCAYHLNLGYQLCLWVLLTVMGETNPSRKWHPKLFAERYAGEINATNSIVYRQINPGRIYSLDLTQNQAVELRILSAVGGFMINLGKYAFTHSDKLFMAYVRKHTLPATSNAIMLPCLRNDTLLNVRYESFQLGCITLKRIDELNLDALACLVNFDGLTDTATGVEFIADTLQVTPQIAHQHMRHIQNYLYHHNYLTL